MEAVRKQAALKGAEDEFVRAKAECQQANESLLNYSVAASGNRRYIARVERLLKKMDAGLLRSVATFPFAKNPTTGAAVYPRNESERDAALTLLREGSRRYRALARKLSEVREYRDDNDAKAEYGANVVSMEKRTMELMVALVNGLRDAL